MRGVFLWLRARHVPIAVAVSLVTSGVVGSALAAIMADGTLVDEAPLLVAFVAMLPMTAVLSREHPWELAHPRSVAQRRGVLVVLVGALLLIPGAVFILPVQPDAWTNGIAAYIRDIVAFLGLTMAVAAVARPWATWIPLTLVFFATILVTPSYPPTTAESLWLFLRMPGGIVLPEAGRAGGGWFDGSWLVTLVICAVGVWLYLFREYLRERPDRKIERGRDAAGASSARPTGTVAAVDSSTVPDLPRRLAAQGLRRSTLTPWLLLATSILVLWMGAASMADWAGNVYVVLTTQSVAAPFIVLPWGVAVGVIVGQSRWRSGLYLSDRAAPHGRRRSLARHARLAAAVAVTAIGCALLGLALVAAMINLRQGGSLLTILEDFLLSLPTLLVPLVLCGMAAALGATLGWLRRPVWVAPAAAVITLALVIAGLFRYAGDTPTDRVLTLPEDHLVCEGTGPRLCATPADAAYLSAIRPGAEDFYTSRRAYSDLLPSTVYISEGLVHDASTPEDQRLQEQRPGRVSLTTHRDTGTPQPWSAQLVEESLLQSLPGSCVTGEIDRSFRATKLLTEKRLSPGEHTELQKLLGACDDHSS